MTILPNRKRPGSNATDKSRASRTGANPEGSSSAQISQQVFDNSGRRHAPYALAVSRPVVDNENLLRPRRNRGLAASASGVAAGGATGPPLYWTSNANVAFRSSAVVSSSSSSSSASSSASSLLGGIPGAGVVLENVADPVSSNATSRLSPEHNSEDEYAPADDVRSALPVAVDDASLEAAENNYEEALKTTTGFVIKRMQGDGACLFRSVADQVYGDQEMHDTVRSQCMDYIAKNRDYFSQFITEDFQTYVRRKRNLREHGNHVEMQAMAELFNRSILVYQYTTEPINAFDAPNSADDQPPIRLSYHGCTHYNSIIDPYNPTYGVGLGMPGLHPGQADKRLMGDAAHMSEREDIERLMLEDKLATTDSEATDLVMQQQAQFESLKLLQKQRTGSPQPGCSSLSAPCSRVMTPVPLQPHHSPPPYAESDFDVHDDSSNAVPVSTTAGVPPDFHDEQPGPSHRLPPESVTTPGMFGLSDWCNDTDVIARVLAQSQQEYLDQLKRKRETKDDCSSRSSK